jgi:transposase
MENFVGVDLHKRVSQLARLREAKPASQLRFTNDVVTVEKLLKKLPQGSKIAFEATGSWWWFVDLAERTGHEVVMSHPKQTKAIASARLKSDKVDALMLARLLKADFLPTVWIPPAVQRHLRELLAHRARLVRQRTSVINELHALYAKRNIDCGMIFHRVRPPAFRAADLGGYGERIAEEDVALLGFLNRQLQGLDKELKTIAEQDPVSKRLMTIPGVGPVSAVAASCWIGTIERFSNSKKLSSYFGLAPKVRQSAERERHGHITKEGNRMVRWLLIQAALWHIRRGPVSSRKHYLGVLKRRGKQIARVAAANKLLGIMFQMLKEKIDYEEFLRRGGNAQ